MRYEVAKAQSKISRFSKLCAFVPLCLLSFAYSQETLNSLIGARVKLLKDYSISVNGFPVEMDVFPLEYSGVVYVPVRAVASYLQAKILWDNEKKQVSIMLGNREIVLKEKSLWAKVAGKRTALLSPPFIYQGRTMVPLRQTAEGLGGKVKETAKNMNIRLSSSVPVLSGRLKTQNNEEGRPERMVRPKNKNANTEAGWAGWRFLFGVRERIHFVFVKQLLHEPSNRVVGPVMLFAYGVCLYLFFSEGVKSWFRQRVDRKEREEYENVEEEEVQSHVS